MQIHRNIKYNRVITRSWEKGGVDSYCLKGTVSVRDADILGMGDAHTTL
jgi:hypothetical protein